MSNYVNKNKMETNHLEKETWVGQIVVNTIFGDVGRICSMYEDDGVKYARFSPIIDGEIRYIDCPFICFKSSVGKSKTRFLKKVRDLGYRWSIKDSKYVKVQKKVEGVGQTIG